MKQSFAIVAVAFLVVMYFTRPDPPQNPLDQGYVLHDYLIYEKLTRPAFGLHITPPRINLQAVPNPYSLLDRPPLYTLEDQTGPAGYYGYLGHWHAFSADRSSK